MTLDGELDSHLDLNLSRPSNARSHAPARPDCHFGNFSHNRLNLIEQVLKLLSTPGNSSGLRSRKLFYLDEND